MLTALWEAYTANLLSYHLGKCKQSPGNHYLQVDFRDWHFRDIRRQHSACYFLIFPMLEVFAEIISYGPEALYFTSTNMDKCRPQRCSQDKKTRKDLRALHLFAWGSSWVRRNGITAQLAFPPKGSMKVVESESCKTSFSTVKPPS